MILSKGCPYACSFCIIHQREPFSIRSIASIDQELAYLAENGTQIVNFEDDNLFHNKDYSFELLALLKKYHNQGMQFAAMNGVTARNIVHIVEDIIEAGFIELNLSLVSADNQLQHNIKRPHGLNSVKHIAEQVKGRIPLLAFLIAGLPGSDPSRLIADIMRLARLNLTIGLSPLYLVPGAGLFTDIALPENQRLMRGSALYQFGEHFTRNNVSAIWKFVRMLNHIKQYGDKAEFWESADWYYFKLSLQRKQWFAKNNTGKWVDGFSFGCDFPKKITLCTYSGSMLDLKLK